MESTPHTVNTGSVPKVCLAAGAQLGERDGHVVAALYGSAQGEIAACMSHVGLADRSDLGVLELRGDDASLDRALAGRLGDPAVPPGAARRQRGVWYLRPDKRRALVVAPHGVLAALPPLGHPSELVTRDIGESISMVSVVGPRATRLLTAAGLPGDLPIGALGRDPRDANVVAILRESQRRALILVRAPAIETFWARLLDVGEPLGATFVGCEALSLLGAASIQAPI